MPSTAEKLAESHGPRLGTEPKSLWKLLQEGVEKNPDGLALACTQHPKDHLSLHGEVTDDGNGPGGEGSSNRLEWSYSQLKRKAENLADRMRGLDVAAERSTIVPFLPSGPEWVLWFWTAARLNMPIAAVDPKVLSGHVETSTSKETRDAYVKALHPHIVIVHDDFAAVAFDDTSRRNGQTPALKIIADPHSTLARPLNQREDGWITQQEIMCSSVSARTNGHHESDGEAFEADAVARILFTGGSTGHPKGCPHSHANLTAESEGFNTMRGLTPESRTLIQSPAHHIMANAAALLSWRAGSAVIFPFNGNQFDAGQSIEAFKTYNCTYLPVHHSMLDAILRHPSFDRMAVYSVRSMQIGGALIGDELAARYQDKFGGMKDGFPLTDIFPFWGSTEGMYTTAWVKGDAIVSDSSNLLAVGRAYTGGRVKVVDPDTGTTLARGDGSECVGELHFGGDTVIKEYLGGVSPDSFYTEGGLSWFRTGDQGRMTTDGAIFMLGRYKDMIKRGGENIFPQQLEYTLQSICATKAQIIGIPDSITGEACVAVVDTSKSENFSKLQLQLDVSKHIGPEFIFVHILTLQDLGLADFPLGPGGKVRKPDLKKMVLEHLNNAKQPETLANGNSASSSTGESQDYWIKFVKLVWADLLHIESSELGDDFRLEHFTDSLTAMRYCFEIERLTLKRLTVEDVRESPTIRDQAKLVSGSSTETNVGGKANNDVPQRIGPPIMADMMVCRGQESRFLEIKELARPVLEKHGVTWDDDVQECFRPLPLWRGIIMLPATRTHNLRFAFEVHGLEYSEVKEALVEILKVQPLLVSTAIKLENQLVYLQLRPSDHVLNNVITREPQFDSVDSAVQYALHEPFKLVCHPPEMLARFGISPISGEGSGPGPTHVVTLSHSHTICDGMTNAIIMSELDAQVRLLRARKTGEIVSPPHISPRLIPYKLVCDMYDSLDNSLAAETSRKVIASRYHGIAKEAVTPWPMFDQSKVLSIFGLDGGRATDIYHGGINIQRSRRVPGILSLQDIHGIPPSVALKVAYGLAMMQMTGKKTAVYMGVDAARHWPFQDAWTQAQLPNPLLIGGPTTVLTWERLKLESDSVTVLDVFRRTLAEDLEVAPHTHVFNSHEGIIAHLPPEDAAFVRESRCFDPKIALNHVPDVGRFTGADGMKALKLRGVSFFGTGFTPLQSGFDRSDRELCVIAGLVDDVQWDDPEKEVGGFEEKILRTLGDIVKPENWEAAAFRFAEPVEE